MQQKVWRICGAEQVWFVSFSHTVANNITAKMRINHYQNNRFTKHILQQNISSTTSNAKHSNLLSLDGKVAEVGLRLYT